MSIDQASLPHPDSSGMRPEGSSVKPAGPKRLKLLSASLLIVAIAGGGTATWALVLRDYLVPKRFGVVVPGEIFRSGQISRHLIAEVVDRHHIGTIVDLNGSEPANADQRAEVDVAQSKGIRLHRFPLRGNGTGPIEHYADAIEVLVNSQRSGTPALVHCVAGTQRTGTCVSFYRLLVRREAPESVYAELCRYGWDPRSNGELLKYINGHMRALAGLLVRRHVLERVPEPLPQLHP